jgi:HEAT repeat protein
MRRTLHSTLRRVGFANALPTLHSLNLMAVTLHSTKELKLNNYLIKIITLFSTIYLVASFFIPIIQHLLWLTASLILVNYALSLSYLFEQGKITKSLVILNLVQLGLFCHLHWLIYDGLGPEHYAYTLKPHWYDWVQLVSVHVLRAVDLLDALGAYGIHLQNVIHQSMLAGMVLFGMHIMVDIFLLGAVFMLISRRSASQQATTLMKMQRVTERFKNTLTFFKRIRFWTFWLALALIIMVGSRQDWSLSNWFLWPLDNVLRTLDFGDAFQIFDWQLHSIEMGFGLATLAVFFRLVVSFYAFGLVNRLFLFLLGGRGKTIQELVRICISPEASEEEITIAFKALLRFDTKTVIPPLIRILNEGQLHFRRLAAEALEEKGSRAVEAIPALVIALTDDDSSLRLAAKQALNKIEPQWQQHESIQSIIPQLVNQILESQKGLQKTLILSTLKTIEPKSEKTVALLIQALTKNEASEIRVAAIKVTHNKIMPNFVTVKTRLLDSIMINTLSDYNSRVRRAAILFLGKINLANTEIVCHLFDELIDSYEAKVRRTAILVLKRSDIHLISESVTLCHFFERMECYPLNIQLIKAIDTFELIKWLPKDKMIPYLLAALLDKEKNPFVVSIFKCLNEIEPQWAKRISGKTFYDLVEGFKKSISEYECDKIIRQVLPSADTSYLNSLKSQPDFLHKQIMGIVFNVETALNQIGFVSVAVLLAILEKEESIRIRQKLEGSIKILAPKHKWKKAYRSYKNMRYWDY